LELSMAKPVFFHGRATYAFRRNRFYRIYLRPDGLLFVQAGPGPGDNIAQAGMAGGAVGGLIGGLVAQRMQKKTAARQQVLDQASDADLARLIAEDKHSFEAPAADLWDVGIDPPSVWHATLHSSPHHTGLLRLRHRDRGKMTIELLNADDMRVAVEGLPAVLGPVVTVNVVWDRTKNRYVRAP
jgi:hypothetical protein